MTQTCMQEKAKPIENCICCERPIMPWDATALLSTREGVYRCHYGCAAQAAGQST